MELVHNVVWEDVVEDLAELAEDLVQLVSPATTQAVQSRPRQFRLEARWKRPFCLFPPWPVEVLLHPLSGSEGSISSMMGVVGVVEPDDRKQHPLIRRPCVIGVLESYVIDIYSPKEKRARENVC